MGLDLSVGVYADLLVHDTEGAAWIAAHLQESNALLTASGLPEHHEPRDADLWSAQGYGYSGLHALREVAGLLWQGKPLPRDYILDGSKTPANDALFAAWVRQVEGRAPSLLDRIRGRRPPVPAFSHLVAHGDAQGYYVPIDFPEPLVPDVIQDDSAEIWPLGSVHRLADELARLAQALDVPDDLEPESAALQDALEEMRPAPDGPLWLAQPVASYSALILRDACRASLRSGAAIVFH